MGGRSERQSSAGMRCGNSESSRSTQSETVHVLTSLEVTNYRAFSRLVIGKLGRVNLVVGKNGVGKTTLLEALRLYGSIWPRSTVASLLHERNEVARSTDGTTVLLLHSLFHGGNPQNGDAIEIRQSEAGEGRTGFHASARFLGEEKEEFKTTTNMFVASATHLALDVRWPGRKFTLFVDGSAEYVVPSASPKPPNFSPDPAILPGAGVHDRMEGMIPGWWDDLSLTEAEQRVLDALQVVAPIRGIRLVGDPRDDTRRIAKTRIEGMNEPVALAALGGGVVRMFQIAVAMEYAALRSKAISDADARLKNVFPLLLIDEVETGIHYTLHAQLWRFIVQAARRLDVQVFATTHSFDCLRGFAEAVAEDEENDGLIIRLEKVEGEEQTGAVTIKRDDLPIIVRDSIEVR